ncbi:hypothetical protein ACLOJK_024907 [Asimina triloba]
MAELIKTSISLLPKGASFCQTRPPSSWLTQDEAKQEGRKRYLLRRRGRTMNLLPSAPERKEETLEGEDRATGKGKGEEEMPEKKIGRLGRSARAGNRERERQMGRENGKEEETQGEIGAGVGNWGGRAGREQAVKREGGKCGIAPATLSQTGFKICLALHDKTAAIERLVKTGPQQSFARAGLKARFMEPAPLRKTRP